MGYIVCKDSATNEHILFNKDVTAVRVVSATAVNLYFNSQDGSGADVNVIQFTVKSGKAPLVAEQLANAISNDSVLMFDDVDGKYDLTGVSAVNSVTFNGVPDSGTFSKQVVETLTADKTVADSDSGKMFRIDTDGIAIDLPVADAGAVGQVFEFVVATAQTSSNVILIKADKDNSDLLIGKVHVQGTGTGTDDFFSPDGSANNQMSLSATTTGGAAQGFLKFTYTAVNEILVEGSLLAGGTNQTAATPFGTQA